MAEIFISYKSERRAAARHLKKVLECYFQTDARDCVWYDYGLIPGDEFEPRLMAEIAKAKVVIVLWCRKAVESEWVQREAREAKRTGKFLPVKIEPCALAPDFAGADTINLSTWDASPSSPMLHRLLEDLSRRLQREALSRVSKLRELEEDWRGYGAPSLAHFALSQPVETEFAVGAPAAWTSNIGPAPTTMSPNLRAHWENAKRGDPEALCEIAWHYFEGTEGLLEDGKEALRLARIASENGDWTAQHLLGLIYVEGRGVPRDDKEAARAWKIAADRGASGAQYCLGVMHAEGRAGLPEDRQEASRLYKLAADQGHAEAQCALGLRLLEDNKAAEAARYFKLSADQNHAFGQFNLGMLHLSGRGVPADTREARRLIELASNQDDEDAQCQLGYMHRFGLGAVRNDQEAVRWYKLAAARGHATAQYNLGHMYLEGCGVGKDEREGARLIKLSSDQGDLTAQVSLGVLYMDGRGVRQDDKEAVRAFRLGADRGHASSQYYLGFMYEEGRGVPKDRREAVRLYEMAAESDDGDAKSALNRLTGV